MTEADVWNRDAFMQGLGGMQPYAGSLISAYIGSTESHLSGIAEAWQQQDMQRLHRIAHALKGSSSQMGCVGLAALAADLESMTQNGHLPSSGPVEALQQQAVLVLDAMRPFSA